MLMEYECRNIRRAERLLDLFLPLNLTPRIPPFLSSFLMKFNLRAIILGVLVLGLGYIGFKMLSSMKAAPERKPEAPLKLVAVQTVANDTLPYSISITGQLRALQRSELYAEVQGTFRKGSREFREGIRFSQGEVLLQVDDREARASFLAQRSQYISSVSQLLADLQLDFPSAAGPWENYLRQLTAGNDLPEPPAIKDEKLELFLNGRGILTQYHNLRAAGVRLDKHTLRAPYDGVLTQALADPGTLVRPGQKLGEFIRTGTYEMEAAVPTRERSQLRIGQKVELRSNELRGTWTGTVKRYNSVIDPATQSIQVYLEVSGNDLAEGLYLTGEMISQPLEGVVELPRAVIYDNRFVYLVTDSLLVKQEVDVLQFTGSKALVSGIPNGSTVMLENMPSAYEGMKVAPKTADRP